MHTMPKHATDSITAPALRVHSHKTDQFLMCVGVELPNHIQAVHLSWLSRLHEVMKHMKVNSHNNRRLLDVGPG